jgi:putative peptidoglycan lipid II flippase
LKLLKDSVFLSILTLIVSIVSFFNQILIAQYFGTSSDLELYIAVTSLPTLFAGIISSGFNFIGFPAFVRIGVESSVLLENFAIYIIRYFLIVLIIVLIILGYFITEFGDYMYGLVYSDNSRLTSYLLLLSLITSCSSVVVSITNCYFNARSKFHIPVLLNILPFLTSILITFNYYDFLGILSVALGMFIGITCSMIISLLIIFKNRTVMVISQFNKKDVVPLLYSIPIAGVSMLCFSIYQSVDSYWGLKLGQTSLAYLSYCQRLIIAFGGLIAVGPFTVFVPLLTKNYESKSMHEFYQNIIAIIKTLALVLFISAVLFSVYAYDAVTFFFERGKFNHNDSLNLSSLIPIYLIGMVFMLIASILFRILFITHKLKSAAIISLSSALSYFIFCGFLSNFYQVYGIGYAYIFSWIIAAIASLYIIFIDNPMFLFNKKLFTQVFVGIVCALSIYILLTKMNSIYLELFPHSSINFRFGYIFFTSSISFFMYFYILHRIKVSEIQKMKQAVCHLFFKKPFQ